MRRLVVPHAARQGSTQSSRSEQIAEERRRSPRRKDKKDATRSLTRFFFEVRAVNKSLVSCCARTINTKLSREKERCQQSNVILAKADQHFLQRDCHELTRSACRRNAAQASDSRRVAWS